MVDFRWVTMRGTREQYKKNMTQEKQTGNTTHFDTVSESELK